MKKLFLLASLSLLVPTFLIGCASQETLKSSTSNEKGTLSLVANGEDFVRQGFVSKDGWRISFDHVYVTLADVAAYQTDPPFDPDAGDTIKAKETVILLDKPKTVDLAEDPEDAQPILVAQVEAPTGQYNVLSWEVVEAGEGPAEGQTIVLDGTATKDGQTIDFLIGFNQRLNYACGEFVGDERKGILKATAESEVETTFHFDHIFGDANAPADDPLNTGAVGFQPMVTLAEDGTLEVDVAILKKELSSEDYQTFQKAIAGLGHVGEGHCTEQLSVINSNEK